MGLSADLIAQFVKITNDNKDVKNETTVYGTIVKNNGSDYVRFDGSDLLTPVTSTAFVGDGDRVTVMIKNHTAIVTGNLTSPSARNVDVKDAIDQISEFEIIMSYKVTTAELNAIEATITSLKSKIAKISSVEADIIMVEELQAKFANLNNVNADDVKALNADIENLQARIGKFADVSTEELTAMNADIEKLYAYTADFTYVSAEVLHALKANLSNAEIKYANIDFSNISEATMQKFYANSGLIKNATINDGTITGELTGVTITGDLIKGNTIVADKLVIKGDDGLYHKLNTDGVTVEAEQTDYNSLNGSVITAKSITANKISVSDLVSFGATIGGFKITDNSIYSGVKTTVGNTTRGIYLDNDGQVAFGDSNNFIKFYKDQNVYKLVVTADDITFGSSKKSLVSTASTVDSLSSTVSTINNKVTTLDNTILAWCYNNNTAYINGGKIYAKSITTAQLATDAIKSLNYVSGSTGSYLNLSDGSFNSKYLKWTSTGALTATSGTIGGITINSNGLSAQKTTNGVTVGYSINNSGTISVKNIGSGRDSMLYLDSDYLSMESYSSASGGDPLHLAIGASGIFMGQTSGDNTAKVYNDGAGVLYLYGASGIVCKSNVHAEKDINVDKNINSVGYIMPKSGQFIHTANGTSGTNGYVKIARIKITGQYANQPIFIEYARRGDKIISNLVIRFNSSDGTDPGLALFKTDGSSQNAYLHKAATSTWDLYIKKSEAYDTIDVLSYYAGSYARARMTMTWTNEMVTSLPSDYSTVSSYMSSMNYKFGNDKESYITSRTGGGFDFWFTNGGTRICFDGSSGTIYRVTADGTWTALTS